jgi:hypothetical protein
MKRLSFGMALVVAFVLAAVPCVRADHVFYGFPTGDQETPPNQSAASGFAIFVLNNDMTALNFEIQYSGLEGGTVSGAHFHMAPPGVAGDIVRGYDASEFGSPDGAVQESWTANDTQALTPALVGALFDGNIYFNIHTTPTYPGGEIRCQVIYYFSF